MRALESLDADDPAEVGPYRLLGVLGHGGMGRVYLGRSPGGRLAAVKVVHRHLAADERFRARFASEVAATRLVSGRSDHDRIAPVLAADPEAEVPWVATGYMAGSDLARAVQEHGPLPERAVRALGVGLAEALGAVHVHGLVHRDVKPSNVLLTLNGPHLIDFGIARAAEPATRLTTTGVVVGSPGFMAPEQVTGETAVSPATDVFSLATVLAYAATGCRPFSGDNAAQLLYRVAHAEPRLDGFAPGAVRELVSACLAKDPAARPALPEVVQALAGEEGVGALLGPSSRWLPPAVTDDIGRRAVELLQLDSGPTESGRLESGPPESGLPDQEPSVRAPVPTHSPTAVGPAPAPGADAATVTAITRPKQEQEQEQAAKPKSEQKAKPKPEPKPGVGQEPGPAAVRAKKKGPWLIAGAAVMLAASAFGIRSFLPDDEPAALPAPFVGRWKDVGYSENSTEGWNNELELHAGRVGEEVGTLVGDIDDQDGSATCRYRLSLNRLETDGWYAYLDAAPMFGNGDRACGTVLTVRVQQQSYSKDSLQMSADAPVTTSGGLKRVG
ncbi:serine/threonine-protein kinase [Streptomyces sp. NPDC001732]